MMWLRLDALLLSGTRSARHTRVICWYVDRRQAVLPLRCSPSAVVRAHAIRYCDNRSSLRGHALSCRSCFFYPLFAFLVPPVVLFPASLFPLLSPPLRSLSLHRAMYSSQVPASMSDSDLRAAAGFRTQGRLPVLCWVHPNGAPLCRASQPMTGVTGASSEENNRLLLAIRAAAAGPRHKRQPRPRGRSADTVDSDGMPALLIFDCRHQISAQACMVVRHVFKHQPCVFSMRVAQHPDLADLAVQATPTPSSCLHPFAQANQLKGGGYHNVDRLPGKTKMVFLGIENIHVVREALRTVSAAVQSDNATAQQTEDFVAQVRIELLAFDFLFLIGCRRAGADRLATKQCGV